MYEMEGASPGRAARVSRFPGFPSTAGRPPVPYTRVRYRFPGSSHVPGVASKWCPSLTVRVFLLPRRVPCKGFAAKLFEFFAIHTPSTEGA
jgi:hypothetical protein